MFVRARTAFGGHHINEAPPRTTQVRNALVQGWAVYDDRRLLVPDSAFTREGIESGGMGLATIGAGSTTNLNPYGRPPLPDDEYVWIGHIHEHFGHFIVSTLSRLWAVSRASPNAKLVTACPGDLDRRLAIPFVAAIMSALGLTRDRFVEVADYTIVPTLLVPEALFVENSSANRMMSGFCMTVADQVIAAAGDRPSALGTPASADQFIFLTKRAVRHGIRTIVNEAELIERLEQGGMMVVSPETFTLADQIRLWRLPNPIGSFEGSSLHTAIFSQGKKMLSVGTNSSASSNQALLNALGNHQSLYLNSNGALEESPPASGFQIGSRLTDPQAAARSILDAASYLARSDETMRMRSMRDTVSPWLFTNEPFGRNLSRDKLCDLSSVDPNWAVTRAGSREEAAGAVNGRLSGRYQFHSSPETRPWWQVDLGRTSLVTEVRVFNRNDVAQHRARNIVLSCSVDGADWTTLAKRDEADDFGGGRTPRPWRWWQDVPFEARYLRLALDTGTREFLHLDQVEVFGFDLEPGRPISF